MSSALSMSTACFIVLASLLSTLVAVDGACKDFTCADTCIQNGCEFCYAGYKVPTCSEADAMDYFYAGFQDPRCATRVDQLKPYADDIDVLYTMPQSLSVSNPARCTKLFGGRIQIIVANYAYEFSSGTSNQPYGATAGFWVPSGGFILKGANGIQDVCVNIPMKPHDQQFNDFGSMIFKPKYQQAQDFTVIMGNIQADPAYARTEGVSKYFARFDTAKQLKYSMMLSNSCDKIFADANIRARFTNYATLNDVCKAAAAKLVPFRKYLPNLSTSASVSTALSGQYCHTTNAWQANVIMLAHNVPDATNQNQQSYTDALNECSKAATPKPGAKAYQVFYTDCKKKTPKTVNLIQLKRKMIARAKANLVPV